MFWVSATHEQVKVENILMNLFNIKILLIMIIESV